MDFDVVIFFLSSIVCTARMILHASILSYATHGKEAL